MLITSQLFPVLVCHLFGHVATIKELENVAALKVVFITAAVSGLFIFSYRQSYFLFLLV